MQVTISYSILQTFFRYNLQHAEMHIHMLYYNTCNCHSHARSIDTPCFSYTIPPHPNCFFFLAIVSNFLNGQRKTIGQKMDKNVRLNKCHFGTHVDPLCLCVCACVYLCDYPGTGFGWPAQCTVTVADAHMVGVYIP